MTVKLLLPIADRRAQQVSRLLGRQQHQKLSQLSCAGLNGQHATPYGHFDGSRYNGGDLTGVGGKNQSPLHSLRNALPPQVGKAAHASVLLKSGDPFGFGSCSTWGDPKTALHSPPTGVAPEEAPAARRRCKLKLWIMFVLSCVAWLVVGDRSSIASPVSSDKELGILRLQQLPIQPSQSVDISGLGILRVRQLPTAVQRNNASELGRLRLQQIGNLEIGRLRVRQLKFQLPKLEAQSSRPSQPIVRLIGQVGYFQSNNIFSGVDPTDGGLISTGLALWATPILGPKTSVVTAIDGSLIAYVQQSEFSYSQLRFRAGIRQQLMPGMYGEIGWNNQQLFRAASAGRFLSEHSIRLALYRQDRFTDRLRLNSFYEFRLSFADPESRSRIINSLLVSLSYYLQNNLQVGIDYQFGLSKFTQREREDQYQRVLGRLTYALSRNSQVGVQGGLSLGASSDPNINFNDFFFSISYTVELGRF